MNNEVKDFVKDGLSTDDIRLKIKNIRTYLSTPNNLSKEDKIKYLELTEAFFVERYPFLFDMCTRDDFNYDNLNYFLNMRDAIINNQKSFEDASKEVGKEWFDKHFDASKLKKTKKNKK